jgi:hypothetical protein
MWREPYESCAVVERIVPQSPAKVETPEQKKTSAVEGETKK